MHYQVTQGARRFGEIGAIVHGFRIQVLTVAGIGVICIHVDARGTLASVQSLLRKLARWIGLTPVNYFRTWISLMDCRDKRSQKIPVLLGIAPWIPIANVLFVPQSSVVDPIMEAVHHLCDVAIECGSLLRSSGRPEHGVQAAIVVMKRSRFGRAHIR